MLIVQKFGGSSLADPACLERAAGISREARRRAGQLVVVVSAAGDTTDELIELAHKIDPTPPLREMDALIITGEQQSAALMAIMLGSLGVPARSYSGWQAGIYTDPTHGGAAVRAVIPERLRAALDAGITPVVAGFQGLNAYGDVSTLGRGGSDTTAVALAAALGADRCEIYTDVDGIYTADPRLVENARCLEEIDFRDMLALARGGSQVLHPDSVRLAMAAGMELWLLSSFAAGPGSVVRRLPEGRRPPFAGVTRDRETGVLTAVGRAASGETLSALGSALAAAGIPTTEAQAGEGCVRLKVAPEQLDAALTLSHRLLFRL